MPAAGPARSQAASASTLALHQAAFTALPDPAALLDADGRVLTVNAQFETVFGAGSWRGRTLDRLFCDPLDAHAAPWRRAAARAFHAVVKHGDGAGRPTLIRYTRLGLGAGLAVFTADEAAKARAAINQARLAETFAAPQAGAFGMDLVTGQGQVSGFLNQLFAGAHTNGALSRQAWLAAMEPGEETRALAAIEAAAGQLFAPVRFTVRVRDSSSGAVRALRHDLTVAALGEEGRPIRLTGALTDVTDLAAETAAREDAEQALALSVEMGALTAWRYDPQTAEGQVEGPDAAALGGPHFTVRRLSAALGGEAARRLHAALCAAEYGGRVDLTVQGPQGVYRVRGERLRSGLIEGFLSAEPPARSADLTDPAGQAAASARMSAWSYDIGRRRLRLSGPVLDTLGLSGPEHEMDIADWRARVPEEDRTAMDRATQALNDQGVADVEYRVRSETGELVWIALRGGVSEQDAAGAPLRFSGFFAEINERKHLERELAEREQQLADAVDAGLVGIWTYDYANARQTARGRILDWMGKPRDADSIDPADWISITHPDDMEALRDAFACMTRGEPVQRLDARFMTPGGWRWVRTHGAPVENKKAGGPRRAAGVIVDIHAERAFEQALRSEKARFEAVYRKTPALLHTIGTDGRTLSVSDYWLQRMGYKRDDVIGAPGWAFMDEESAARMRETVIPSTIERGWVENEPVTAFTASGERLELRLSAFLERGPDGAPVAVQGVFSDVTDLKAAQREMEDHAAALERSNRELNRFATVASHDLQEPLRKISAFASLLLRKLGPELDGQDADALDYLVDAAGRMRVLIDDLLAYSRASNRALELEDIALQPMVEGVLTGLDLQIAEAGADIRLGALPVVRGDAVLLSLLFQNLIANALKYRKGHTVRIGIDAWVRDDAVCEITVRDDGIGFDPTFAEKIFEPFARLHTREAYAGTGIGLAICQQAAERLGGRIGVKSAPGEGSAFTVTLPLARSRASGPSADA